MLVPITVTSTGSVASLGRGRKRDITRILYTLYWLLMEKVVEVPITLTVVVVDPLVI